VEVLNGEPGYINMLDALNSWQLVNELSSVLKLPAAASFKHVSPAGAAVYVPLSDRLREAYFVDGMELSELAIAYARARGADRMSSFGDWVALSDEVDVSVAKLLRREVSDGVIAPAFEPEALEILRKKKGGKYPVVRINTNYEPPYQETRQVFGVSFEQRRNNLVMSYEHLNDIVTINRELPETAQRDLIVGLVTLKYSQSNSVCLTYDGQVIGNGAGQQSRIHCTRLASEKAVNWFLRQHPAALDLPFRKKVKRPDKNNGVDQFLRDDLTPAEERVWRELFDFVPQRLSGDEKRKWLQGLDGVSLTSDGFFPFRDNIDRASRCGVKYVAQPGGSIADEGIIEACNDYGMAMAITGVRLFHH